MKFDIYGRFELEVLRENDRWIIYRVGFGVRSRDDGVIIPPSLQPEEIAIYLDDLFHELAGRGQAVRLLA
ncbi:MAG TPA: hypothetical protein VL754_18515 [Verrucomicrobiae bacterium]|jgi:hypothetical protein|nr:hypothetical protein [Verrucomicrobiae bacterium]